MGVYIDMDMPKEGFVEILIRDEGTVQQTGKSYRIDGTDYYTPYVGEMPVMYKAISVLPHGRLGDLDILAKEVKDMAKEFPLDSIGTERYRLFAEFIKNAPTIIPASEEGET